MAILPHLKHKRAVNCMELSFSHLFTGGDDGYIHIYDLNTLEWQRYDALLEFKKN